MERVGAQKISRRNFTGLGPFFLFRSRALASPKTLRIARWPHLVPEFDQWFEGVFAKEWGLQHDTRVVVDRIPIDQVHARAAGEVAAGRGHDLFLFPWPPAEFHRHAIDHTEVYQRVGDRHGTVSPLGHKSTYHPKTKQYFAFADSWIPAPLNYLEDYWAEANMPLGPSTYSSLRGGVRRIRAKRGAACGLALTPGLEGNITLETILAAFRTSVQDEDGNVAINSSYMTVEALKYVKALYEDAGTPEALAWGPSGNVRAMLARRTCCTVNAISLVRTAEKENPELARNILFRPALLGPGGRRSVPQVTSCSVVWRFAENKEGAKQFLVDLIDNFHTAFEKSGFCNFPIYQNTVPDLMARLSKDPNAGPSFKYEELKDALHWTSNLGDPGFATPAAMEMFHRAIVPRMFGSVIRGELSAEDAARAAEKEAKSILEKWERS